MILVNLMRMSEAERASARLAQVREYYHANKDKINAMHKRYRNLHKEEIADRQRRWREANKEHCRQVAAARFLRNRDKIMRTTGTQQGGKIEARQRSFMLPEEKS